MQESRISRRGLLRSLGIAVGAGILLAIAGCGAPPPPTAAPKPPARAARAARGAPATAPAPKPSAEAKPAASAPAASGPKKLTLLWHWGKQQTDFLGPYFDEYTKLTGTTIDVQQTSFSEL